MQIDSDVTLPTGPVSVSITDNPLPELHTIKATMIALNCGHSTVYKLAEQGEIKLIKILGKSLVLGLRDFVERQAGEARQRQATN